MRRLIGAELYKVWGKRSFVAVLAVLLCVNLFALWYTQRSGRDNPYPPSASQSLGKGLRGLSGQERIDKIERECRQISAFSLIEQVKLLETSSSDSAGAMIELLKQESPGLYEEYLEEYEAGFSLHYTRSLPEEAGFLNEIWQEAQQVARYPAFLEEIFQKAETLSGISIFSSDASDPFSSRNIQKTARDFAGLQETPITFDISKGFLSATGFFATDLIAIVVMFALAAALLFDEKEAGLFPLVRGTPRGRLQTIAAKLICLSVSLGVVTLLLFGSNLAYASLTTGLGDLARSIQSVGLFQQSILSLSAGQYLLLFLLTKWFSYLLTALLILLICIFAKHPVAAYAAFAGVYAVSQLLYLLIPGTSPLNLFKYVNLISFLRTNDLYRQYLNLNLFGHPVNLLAVSFAALGLSLCALSACVAVCFSKKRSFQPGGPLLQRVLQSHRLPRRMPSRSVTGQEGYKLLSSNRVLLILAAAILLTCYAAQGQSRYLSPQEFYYKSYLLTLQGELTPQKEEWLAEQQREFDAASQRVTEIAALVQSGEISPAQGEAMKAPYEKALEPQDAFDKVVQRAAYIKEHPGTQFVYDTGYRELFGLSGNAIPAALQLIVCCIFSFSSVFSMEYQYQALRLLRTTPKGRRDTALRKLLLSAAVSLLFFAIAYLPQLISIGRDFGFPQLSAPVGSLPEYGNFPSWISLAGFLTLIFLVRAVCCLWVVLVLLALSLRLKNAVLTMMCASLLLAAPVLLYQMGLKLFFHFSTLPLFEWGTSVSALAPAWRSPVYLAILTVTGTLCAAYLIRTFAQPEKIPPAPGKWLLQIRRRQQGR